MLVLIKVTVVFILLILSSKKFKDVGTAMLVSAFFLGLLFFLPQHGLLKGLAETGKTFVFSVFTPFAQWSEEIKNGNPLVFLNVETGDLLLLMILVSVFGLLLERVESLKQMIHSLLIIFRNRKPVLAILPAIIGALPMPGGAKISAPMVEEVAKEVNTGRERKALINYWYRHLWEYWWPLYPAVWLVVNMKELKLTLSDFIILQFPLTVFAVICGLPLLLGKGIKIDPEKPWSSSRRLSGVKPFLQGVWPLLAIILVVLSTKILPWENKSPWHWIFLSSLLIVILVIALTKRVKFKNLRQLFQQGASWSLVLLILGLMIFKNMLTNTQAADQLAQFIKAGALPEYLTVFAIPFIAGLLTGFMPAAIVISFPFILPFLVVEGTTLNHMLLWGFIGGYMGVLTSPVHLCYILSVDHFKANLGKSYQRLLPLLLLLTALGFGYVLLVKYVL